MKLSQPSPASVRVENPSFCGRSGSAVVVILVVLSIMLIYSVAMARSVLRLKEEIRHFERKQLQKFNTPARSVAVLRACPGSAGFVTSVSQYKFDTHTPST